MSQGTGALLRTARWRKRGYRTKAGCLKKRIFFSQNIINISSFLFFNNLSIRDTLVYCIKMMIPPPPPPSSHGHSTKASHQGSKRYKASREDYRDRNKSRSPVRSERGDGRYEGRNEKVEYVFLWLLLMLKFS